jgi:hypothetical protein
METVKHVTPQGMTRRQARVVEIVCLVVSHAEFLHDPS